MRNKKNNNRGNFASYADKTQQVDKFLWNF